MPPQSEKAPRDADPIEFWFDFSSAYAYFAALEIDVLAAGHGRRVTWRPFMLGAAFARTGARGLSTTPMKGDYARLDWARIARLKGVVFSPPSDHPKIALAATRAFYHLDARDPVEAHAFARSVFDAYYAGRLDTSDPDAVCELAAALGLGEKTMRPTLDCADLKARVKGRSEEAIGKGVFGSPWFIADGEPFWGWDRLGMLDQWLGSRTW